MRLPEGVEWSLHSVSLLAMVADLEVALPASKLAEFHDVPRDYLAKSLQQLAAAGIIESARGRIGGYRLARPAEMITVLDVVEALEGSDPSFRCTEIRQRGPSSVAPGSYPKLCGIAAVMLRADAAWRAELAATTIADITVQVNRQAPPDAMKKGAAWLQQELESRTRS